MSKRTGSVVDMQDGFVVVRIVTGDDRERRVWLPQQVLPGAFIGLTASVEVADWELDSRAPFVVLAPLALALAGALVWPAFADGPAAFGAIAGALLGGLASMVVARAPRGPSQGTIERVDGAPASMHRGGAAAHQGGHPASVE